MNKDDFLNKGNKLFYAFMKEARRTGFIDWLEEWDLTEEDFDAISAELKLKTGLEL